MAYGNYPNYYFPQMQMQSQQQPQMPSQQVQSSGFVSVRSETEARNYPVAYGNSVTFKDETAPYIYTKTMGFSQLDRPVFDKYKLVKEEASDFVQNGTNNSEEDKINKTTLEKLQSEIGAIWRELDALKKTSNVKKVLDDESA